MISKKAGVETVESQQRIKEGRFTRAEGSSNTHKGIVGNNLIGRFRSSPENRAQDTKGGCHDEEDLTTEDIRKTAANKKESCGIRYNCSKGYTSGGKGICGRDPRSIRGVTQNGSQGRKDTGSHEVRAVGRSITEAQTLLSGMKIRHLQVRRGWS